MTNQEMKLLHERMKKEDPKLLVLMEKCFDAGVLSGKEPPERPWVGLTHEEAEEVWKRVEASDFRDCVHLFAQAIEAKLKEKNT